MSGFDQHVATILYVDDEELARKYFMRSFGADYHVMTADGADAAIGVLRNADLRIDVVVTDYQMPGRDGGELLRQIEQEFPHIVRILLTAYANKNLLLKTVNSGEIFRILEKPLDVAAIRNALRRAVELARMRNDRKQRFMAIDETLAFLAHELNTPLATIANFARGVQRRTAGGDASPQQQREIEKVAAVMHDNARYCQAVLSTFVDSVRHAGSSALDSLETTAANLIESLLDTYPLNAAQRAAIDVHVERDFEIVALPNCVSLVLSSVLTNALRALKEVALPQLRFAVLVDGHPQIHVIDNGPGIPPQVMQHLLQDPVTTHAEAGGSGWGMIFCKRIMQSFGGGIRIDTGSGWSTRIILDFPEIKGRQ
jgi:two-component system response regulator PhcR